LPTPVTPTFVPETAPEGSKTFDKASLLERVGADRAIVKEIIDLFLVECPKLLNDLRKSVRDGNAKDLAVAAHTLRGALSAVSAVRAVDIARTLELMGQNGDFSDVGPVGDALEAELGILRSALMAAGQ
jgi:HPt (histidine-containing phosphotransfer) domain-containing protein